MQNVNLMPSGYARNQRAKRRFLVATAVMLTVVIAMFGPAMLTHKWARQKRHSIATLEQKANQLKAARAELATQAGRLGELADEFSVIQTLARNRHWASCLAHIAEAANDNILLTRASIAPVKRQTDDSGRSDSHNPRTSPNRTAGSRPQAGREKPPADESSPKKLLLLLEGYALTNTDITRFISALNQRRIFEKVTFKGSEMAHISARQLSRFELECPIRYGAGR